MHRSRRVVAAAVVAATTTVLSFFPASAQVNPPDPPSPELPPEVVAELVVADIVDYVHAVETANTLAALDEMAHAIAAVSTPPPVVDAPRVTSQSQVVAPSAPVTGACGGATNGADAYIARESGGNPNVYNTGGSGAWGCYQLMPEHFAPGGSCDDMVYGAASPADQARCASRLPLSAWGG